MTNKEAKLTLSISENDADIERLDKLTNSLIRDIHELGVNSIERPSVDDTHEGAKGDTLTFATLTLAISPVLLAQLLDFLKTVWLNNKRQIEFEYELKSGVNTKFTVTSETDRNSIKAKLKEIESELDTNTHTCL